MLNRWELNFQGRVDGVYGLQPSLDEGRLLGGTACSSPLLAEACLAQGPLDSGVILRRRLGGHCVVT